MGFWCIQLLKCSYTLYVVPYPTENYKQWLPNGISWLFIDLLPFWPYDASFPALYDVAVSWLMLKTLIDCIPHPYWMYIKSFSTLRCCGWAYRCIIIAVIRVQVGVNFWGGNVVWLSPSSLYDVAVSWLRLQTPIDCIPHPYWMYTKCFITLRCCGWTYGYGYTLMLMPYYMCRWGWVLGKMGYGQACVML